METVLERLSGAARKTGKKYYLSTFMIILFFILMGSASLYILINSAA